MPSIKTILRLAAIQAVFLLTLGISTQVSAQAAGGQNFVPNQHPIDLLQPLDDTTTSIQVTNGQPFEAFRKFFDISWPWIIGCAAGIAVLWALVGGIQIMLSGSDSGMRDSGKEKFISALVGLLLIGLSGLILEIINPIGFVQ
jgi:hypothetical protein